MSFAGASTCLTCSAGTFSDGAFAKHKNVNTAHTTLRFHLFSPSFAAFQLPPSYRSPTRPSVHASLLAPFISPGPLPAIFLFLFEIVFLIPAETIPYPISDRLPWSTLASVTLAKLDYTS